MNLTCRSCLTKSDDISLSLLSVFPEFEKKSILDLLNFVTSWEVTYSENLPQKICTSCFENLKTTYDFLVLFNNSQRILQKTQKLSAKNSQINNLSGQDSMIVKNVQNIEHLLNSDGTERIVIVHDDESTYQDMVQDIFGGEETKDKEQIIQRPTKKIKNSTIGKTPGNMIFVSIDEVLKQELTQRSCKNDVNISDHKQQNIVLLQEEYEANIRGDNVSFAEEDENTLTEVNEETRNHNNKEDIITYRAEDNKSYYNEGTKEDQDIRLAVHEMERNHNKNGSSIQIVTIDDVLNSTKKKQDNKKTVMSIEDVLKIKPRAKKTLSNNTGPFVCHICNRTYDTRKKLMKHNFGNHHPNWKEKFKCHICGIACKTIAGYKHHLDKHQGKRYPCDQCDKTYMARSKVKEHILRVHEKKFDNKYLCTECGKCFKFAHGLQYHMNKHTNSRNFVCRYCGFASIALNALKRHERVHTGERPYKCKHCKKTFAGAAEKQTHEFRHEGVFRHQCKYCNKKFIQTYNMKVHWMQHKGLYVCEICPRNFADAEILKFHYAHIHKIKDVVIEGEEDISNGETNDNL